MIRNMTMKQWIYPLAAAAVGALVSLYYYAELPAMMAIHFNVSEQPDRWMGKPAAAFLGPAFILVLHALTMLRTKSITDDNKRMRLLSSQASISAILTSLLFVLHLFTLAYNLGYAINPSLFVAAAVGVLFIALGNIMPRLPQNGLRLWRLPERAYARYARVQGRLMVVWGMLVLIAIVLSPSVRIVYLLSVLGSFVALTLAAALYYGTRPSDRP